MATPPNDKPVSQILKFDHHMSNRSPIILNNSYPITESVSDNIFQPMSRPTFGEELPSWDLTSYKNRLKTFAGVWKLQFITPTQMAKAGLYYVGPQDRVRCTFCSSEYDYWQPGEDPSAEHKRQSPHCAFFNDSSDGYDVCGIYTSGPGELPKLQDYLESVGILQEMKPPEHKDLATLEARLQSFEKCLIPLKQNIQTLCEAGFYYQGTGTNDSMRCYYCDQGLIDWDDYDEPWTEHARWSNTCIHVLLNKGKNFIDEVCGLKNTKLKATEVRKWIAEHKDTSIIENNMKVNSTKIKLDEPEISNMRQIKITSVENLQLCEMRDPNTMPDSMLCKICYKEEMKVACVPCGHVVACIQCALSLEHCAMCRQPMDLLMRVHLSMDEEKVNNVEQLPCSSSQCLDAQLDPMLCRVCHEEEMAAVFIPCRHIYACVKCGPNMNECPVCKEGIGCSIQVYL
ncbi:baculoviral IAP repeat-containing protein 7-B-like [Acyrthosiphon pisum]|uniref:RING-type domain-containing protein n=1 Tax=Acyrthosiphon pisum TaxID=7029 RepID=A0A8R2B6J7_ACYPI|nr:baculoviral IAP repeat-containing protein 7-B-like [Acyrthosiphon pisum]|eukprot:XP_008184238.2 PREDICTED: baculoviral IAP repeat-containing protein 7-B-like isoform X1 [Acyrthosiphon pisum]